MLHVLLTTMLKMTAGTRQMNPGSQHSTVNIRVTMTLVTKAYLGSLIEVSGALMTGWLTTVGGRGLANPVRGWKGKNGVK